MSSDTEFSPTKGSKGWRDKDQSNMQHYVCLNFTNIEVSGIYIYRNMSANCCMNPKAKHFALIALIMKHHAVY